jgi:hypothetical protein
MMDLPPGAMRNLVLALRERLAGLTEAEAINALGDLLNTGLLAVRAEGLSENQFGAVALLTANVYVLKGLARRLIEDEQELRPR